MTTTTRDDAELLSSIELQDKKGPCSFLPTRFVLAFWAFLGFFNVYCLRVNLSVALVVMVNSTNSKNTSVSDECPDNSVTKNTTSTGEFNWDENTQGLILGSFFYGYIFTQLPGGWLAEQIGGKKLFGLGVLCTSILTLVTPVAARVGVPCLVAVRVLEGIGEGVTFPAMQAMWAVWAPLYERSKLVSFTYAGAQLGTVFAMPISGLLCEHGFAGGWPSVFYVFGALGCVWFIFWMLIVHETPSVHPRISESERDYILSSVGELRKNKVPTPWRHILTSSAVWGLAAAHFTNNWGFYSMLTCLPTYMKKILHFDITQDGILSGVPYFLLWIVQIMSGFVADFLIKRNLLSPANTRKLLNTTGFLVPGCFMIGACYTGCDHDLAAALLILGMASQGPCMAGIFGNHLDIAPRFAGTLVGITNAVATIPGFLGPQIVGVLTNHKETSGQWRIFFFITGGIYLLGSLVFITLCQGVEQPWANGPPGQASASNQEQNITVQGDDRTAEDSVSKDEN